MIAQQYSRLVQSIPQAVYILDAEGRFTELNAGTERILGRPASDLLGRSFREILAPSDLRPVGEIFQRVMTGQADDVAFQAVVVRPSGEQRFLDITASAIRERRRIVGVYGIAHDVTEERALVRALRESEERLRESEGRLRQVLDALPIGVALAEPPGRLVWHNAAADRIWGGMRAAGPEAYEHYRAWFTETGRRVEGPEWPLARALMHGEQVHGELIDIETFDGRRRTTRHSAVPIRNAAGEITSAVVVHEDVTDARSRDAEQRLLAAALEGLSEGICLVTPEGDVVYANQSFLRIFGLESRPVPGLRFSDWARSPTELEEQRTILRRAAEEGRWNGRVWRRRVSDGRELPLDVVVGRVEPDANTHLLFGIAHDATVDLEREQQLRRAERLASVGTMLSGVAHELNNPLQAILNFAQLLLLDERSAEDRDALSVMEREAQRMAKIVSDLKLIARSTQDESRRTSSADLNEAVNHVMKVQEYHLRTSNIEIRLDLGADVAPIRIDRGQLEQVLLNLVVNAEQAMSAHASSGRLIIRTRASSVGASLHVVDNGPGIPAHNLDRIFDPFFTTKAPGEGTGLGLSLVHSIITEAGGEIRVDSEIGTGTAFRIELPRAEELKSEAAAGRPEPAPAAGSLRLLIVDDEDALRSVMARYLRRRGHTVDTAADGADALDKLDEARYDVILSDLRMPGIGGEALMERLLERGIQSTVIFMTGDAAGAATRLAEAGTPVLLKPVELAEVARAVESRST